MVTDRQQAYDTRQQLFDTMVVHPDMADRVRYKTERMKQNAGRYADVMPGIKWYMVAVIHEMECSQSFSCYLGNGQLLSKVTTIVPKGRGPFASFEEGAMDALKLQGADKITDWSMGHILYFLEGYNGYGYVKRGINSPYLWSGSNHYIKGKYVSDGKFDPEAVSAQIGVALLLQALI